MLRDCCHTLATTMHYHYSQGGHYHCDDDNDDDYDDGDYYCYHRRLSNHGKSSQPWLGARGGRWATAGCRCVAAEVEVLLKPQPETVTLSLKLINKTLNSEPETVDPKP